jgi:hypothetical protein
MINRRNYHVVQIEACRSGAWVQFGIGWGRHRPIGIHHDHDREAGRSKEQLHTLDRPIEANEHDHDTGSKWPVQHQLDDATQRRHEDYDQD